MNVTHNGFNSVLESIYVACQIAHDMQDSHLNAKMVEEVWGAGVSLEC